MIQKSKEKCYNCKHVEGNRFYEFFCHYKLIGAFVEDGKPVDSNHVCEHFEEMEDNK